MKMRRIFSGLCVFFLLSTFCACSENQYLELEECSERQDGGKIDPNVEITPTVGVSCDWVIYDSLAAIRDRADCILIGEVLCEEPVCATGYTEEDFEDYASRVSENAYGASKMVLSICTPYTVRIREVLTTDDDALAAEQEIRIDQIGGTYCGVTLTDGNTEPLEVGGTYVFILRRTEGEDSYFMVTPIQGWAKLSGADAAVQSTSETVRFEVNAINHLYDGLTTLDGLRGALAEADE